MEQKQRVKVSKLLSLVLRHRPELIGLRLDEQGWAPVEALLAGCRARGLPLTLGDLREVVATSDKQRYALSEDETHIRANQGHSVQVDLGYEPREPPELLYHGTGAASVPSIRSQGLQRRSRHHVHLSPDVATARKVGSRHGVPVVLEIRAGEMHRAGHRFSLSANGVWLVDAVPAEFLRLPRDLDGR